MQGLVRYWLKHEEPSRKWNRSKARKFDWTSRKTTNLLQQSMKNIQDVYKIGPGKSLRIFSRALTVSGIAMYASFPLTSRSELLNCPIFAAETSSETFNKGFKRMQLIHRCHLLNCDHNLCHVHYNGSHARKTLLLRLLLLFALFVAGLAPSCSSCSFVCIFLLLVHLQAAMS